MRGDLAERAESVRNERGVRVDVSFACSPFCLVCFECVHDGRQWRLARLCLCHMSWTPGRRKCLDVLREET